MEIAESTFFDEVNLTLSDMSAEAKWDPEIASLFFIDLPRVGEYVLPISVQQFLGINWGNLISFGEVARSFLCLTAIVSNVTELRKTEEDPIKRAKNEREYKFYLHLFKSFKHMQFFIRDMSRREIILIPRIAYFLGEIAIIVKIAGVFVCAVEIYNSLNACVDAYKMLKTLQARREFEMMNFTTEDLFSNESFNEETLQKCCEVIVRDSLLSIAKNTCSLVATIFIPLGGESIGILFSLGSSSLAFSKHFMGHYDHHNGRFQNKSVKAKEMKWAVEIIDREFVVKT